MTEDFIVNRIKLIAGSKMRFAKSMRISRPTLDNFIEKMCAGKTLPKLDYAYAFEKIFDKDISIDKAKEEYNKTITSFKHKVNPQQQEIELLGLISLFERKYKVKGNKILERLKIFIEQYYGGV